MSTHSDNRLSDSLNGIMSQSFNETDLRELCFDFQIDYENLAGHGKEEKTLELILFMKRKGRLLELAQRVAEMLPQTKKLSASHFEKIYSFSNFKNKNQDTNLELSKLIRAFFNESELRGLCFDLGIDYENLAGQGKTQKTFELIQYSHRNELTTELIKRMMELRPSADWSVVQKDIQFDNLRIESLEVVAEAKLVLVGDGNVGKTSLVNRFIYGTFNRHETTTSGVAITRWHIELPCIGSQNARLNIWDFGGQGNMHATHPYFFSRQAVYLVVLNIREDDRVNRAEYWIRLIRAYGGDSPIIIVANKTDQFSALLDQRTLKNKYQQISGFVRTSCQTGEGISDLYSEISKAVCLLEDIKVRTVQSLVNVRRALEEMMDPKSSQVRDTLSLDEYEDICDQYDVAPEQRISFLRRLSDLGVMLYFGDDPRLELNVVLNPFWVTEGVYKIINYAPLIAPGGKLKTSQIRTILPRESYPSDKAMYILDMMRKFELCLALDEQQKEFLLPDLLPQEQPELPVF